MTEPQKNNPRYWEFVTWLVRDVLLGRAMILGGLIYGVLSFSGLNFWKCPFKALTSLPCPGCGMTSATMAMARGDVATCVKSNALTPIMILFWIAVAIGCALPRNLRAKFIEKCGSLEQKTRWPLWFGTMLIIYTLTRWAGLF